MEKEQLEKLSGFITENKGQRKFTQSVDLTLNFTGMDFSKADQRLNMEIKLPNGKGRTSSVILFADDKNLISRAQAAGAKVIQSSELPSIANDKVKMAELLEQELIAQPTLMPQIAKSLGQFLGPRNKMPKPAVGADVGTLIANVSKSVYIRSKGKYLPTMHCVVGTEAMDVNQLAQNIDEVVSTFTKKLGKQHIKSVYVKMTMSKPLKLM